MLKYLLGKLFILSIIGYQINTYLTMRNQFFPFYVEQYPIVEMIMWDVLILNFVNFMHIFWLQIIFFMDKTLEGA